MPHIRFSVVDHRLYDELEKVVPHISGPGIVVTLEKTCSFQPDDIAVFAISVLPADQDMIMLAEEAEKRPCGVVMRTEHRNQWRRLAEIHRVTPLLFVIATGGPEGDFKRMFPGIRVRLFWDLDGPNALAIAEHIRVSASQRAAMS